MAISAPGGAPVSPPGLVRSLSAPAVLERSAFGSNLAVSIGETGDTPAKLGKANGSEMRASGASVQVDLNDDKAKPLPAELLEKISNIVQAAAKGVDTLSEKQHFVRRILDGDLTEPSGKSEDRTGLNAWVVDELKTALGEDNEEALNKTLKDLLGHLNTEDKKKLAALVTTVHKNTKDSLFDFNSFENVLRAAFGKSADDNLWTDPKVIICAVLLAVAALGSLDPAALEKMRAEVVPQLRKVAEEYGHVLAQDALKKIDNLIKGDGKSVEPGEELTGASLSAEIGEGSTRATGGAAVEIRVEDSGPTGVVDTSTGSSGDDPDDDALRV